MERNFDYDEITDSLIISSKKEGDFVKDSFMFDNIVVDISTSGKIVGLEILNISAYLSEFGFNPDILNNIKNAELNIIKKHDSVMLMFKLSSIINSSLIEQKIPVGMIPLVSPQKN